VPRSIIQPYKLDHDSVTYNEGLAVRAPSLAEPIAARSARACSGGYLGRQENRTGPLAICWEPCWKWANMGFYT